MPKTKSSSHRSIPRGLGDLLYWITVGDTSEVQSVVDRSPQLAGAVHPSGTTPLYYSVRHQMPFITEYLLQKGADPNPELPGRISLREMADSLPDEDILELLISAGAKKKTAKQRKSESLPIYPTILNLTASDLDFCRSLRQPVRLPESVSKLSQKRIQVLLAAACTEREAEFGIAILEHVNNPDFNREEEGNPLVNAAESGCLPLVQALVAREAIKFVVDAFCMAVDHGHLDVCRLLRPTAAQAKTFRQRVAKSASYAAEAGYTQLAELLLSYADKPTAKRAKTLIQQWRRRYDEDETPIFFGFGGDEPIEDEDEFLEELNRPQALDAGLVRTLSRQLGDKQPIGELVSLIGIIRENVNSGSDFSVALPKLRKLAKHDNDRVSKAATRTIQAITELS